MNQREKSMDNNIHCRKAGAKKRTQAMYYFVSG